jgi:glycosyltransferase involved in cell wall biosynthesis
MDISIIIPLYNEEGSLEELTKQIVQVLEDYNHSYEICFVDDGSTDDSLARIKNLKEKNQNIKILSFRKNYGKSAALSEGFKMASGEIIITIDADLQDDPAEIPNLIEKINDGYDLVSGWKKKRHVHDFNCGLKAYRQEVIKEIPVYGSLHRYLPVLAHWKGFAIGEISVQHHARKHGVTKYGWRRFFDGFFDLFTVLFLTRYRQKPLHLFGFFGLTSLMAGFIISLYLTILWFQGYGIGSRPLLFLGILLIIVGMQSFSIGLIGEMITNLKDEEGSYSIREKLL